MSVERKPESKLKLVAINGNSVVNSPSGLDNKLESKKQAIEIPPYSSSRVIKAEDLKKSLSPHPIQVNPYIANEMNGARVTRPSYLPPSTSVTSGRGASLSTSSLGTSKEALESLKGNLKSLNDLHSRLRFMLKELETLIDD